MRTSPAVLAVLLCTVSLSAKEIPVTVINHQYTETTETYFIPGYSASQSSVDVNCYSSGKTTDCYGSGTTTGTSSAPQTLSYELSGATLTLRLPDGRIAVVNCNYKLNWTEWGGGVHRSCRVPISNVVSSDFQKDNARISWAVSIDGKKRQYETYRILAILPARD